VQNAQDRIQGIGVGILPHAAAAGARVPTRVEISALDDPLVISIIAADANIVIRDRTCGVRSNSSSTQEAKRLEIPRNDGAEDRESDRRWWTERWECRRSRRKRFFASLPSRGFYLQGRHAAQLGRRCSFLAAVKSQSKPAGTLQWQSSIPTARYHLGAKKRLALPSLRTSLPSSASGGYCGSGPGMESPRSTKPLDGKRRGDAGRSGRHAVQAGSRPIGRFCGTGLNLDGIARPKSGQHAFPLNAQAHAEWERSRPRSTSATKADRSALLLAPADALCLPASGSLLRELTLAGGAGDLAA